MGGKESSDLVINEKMWNPITERQQKNRPWNPEWDKHDWKKQPDGPPRAEVMSVATHGRPGEWVKVSDVTDLKPTGLKSDQGKSRVDLLDPEFLMDVGDVLEFGARKYSAHNWRGGITISRLLGAILRHTFAICRGQDIDPESGKPHSAHLGCTVMFLSWMLKHRPELDDRFKY